MKKNKLFNPNILKTFLLVFLVFFFYNQIHTEQDRFMHRDKDFKHVARYNRPTITGITLNIVYPDGSSKTHTIDPQTTEAMFWSDQSVNKILVPYYDKNPVIRTRGWVKKYYGNWAAYKLTGKGPDKEKVKIDGGFIKRAWYLRSNPYVYAAMFKHPLCDTSGSPRSK